MIQGLKEFALDTVEFNFRAFLFTLGFSTLNNTQNFVENKILFSVPFLASAFS